MSLQSPGRFSNQSPSISSPLFRKRPLVDKDPVLIKLKELDHESQEQEILSQHGKEVQDEPEEVKNKKPEHLVKLEEAIKARALRG
jgi:hypothetical protein